jgi:hypothetical protein
VVLDDDDPHALMTRVPLGWFAHVSVPNYGAGGTPVRFGCVTAR